MKTFVVIFLASTLVLTVYGAPTFPIFGGGAQPVALAQPVTLAQPVAKAAIPVGIHHRSGPITNAVKTVEDGFLHFLGYNYNIAAAATDKGAQAANQPRTVAVAQAEPQTVVVAQPAAVSQGAGMAQQQEASSGSSGGASAAAAASAKVTETTVTKTETSAAAASASASAAA